ncbi:MAG TPA: hypothetical protein VK658_16600 [Chryseolinea sp.]|nr:hypothetical protein [Chryseolinea sp.]
MEDTNTGTESKPKYNEPTLISWTPLLLLSGAALTIWIVGLIVVYTNIYDGNETKAGQLGDTLNIITSIFSALTVSGLLFTIILQRKELHDTRTEFSNQTKNLRKQSFEITFFNLVESNKQMALQVRYDDNSGQFSEGLSSFEAIFNDIHQKVKEGEYEEKDHVARDIFVLIEGTDQTLDVYLKSLHLILKYVDDNAYDVDQTPFYLSIIFSTLTTYQISVLEQVVEWLQNEYSREFFNRLRRLLKSNKILV